MSRDHRRLDAFKLADEMALRVYAATLDFPKSEIYGLRSQLRRAAVSGATNIVEGCARDSDREFERFLVVAFGSIRETIYLVELAGRLEMLKPEISTDLALFGGRAAAAIAGLKKAMRAKAS
jgi:four helix bundle protein